MSVIKSTRISQRQIPASQTCRTKHSKRVRVENFYRKYKISEIKMNNKIQLVMVKATDASHGH